MKKLSLLTLLLSITTVSVWAQLTEMKAFDTSKNHNAAAGRIFMDALKENLIGNSKEAEVLFTRFIEAAPQEADGYYELAKIQIKNNEMVKAIQNIKTAIKLDTGNKWYVEFYANLLAANNKFDEAASLFTNLASKYKPNEEYLLKSSLLYQKSKNYPKAIIDIEKLISIRGPEEELLLKLSQVYQKNNDLDNAANCYKRLISAYPEEGRYYALLAEFYFKHQQEDKAKAIFLEAEQKFPDDISLLLGLASYYKQQKDTEMYFNYLNKAIDNDKIDPSTQITLLATYFSDLVKDSSSRVKATSLIEKLLKKNDANATMYAIYGDLLGMQNRNEEAQNALKKSITLDPNNFNVWQQFLFGYAQKKDADTLIQYAQKALELYPSAAIFYYLKGIGYLYKEDYTQSVEAIQNAIEYQPEDNKALLAEMHASLGEAYNSKKEYQKSEEQYEKALGLDTTNASTLNNYAYYLSLRKSQLDKAEKYATMALRLRPDEATFLDTYGWVLYQQGNYSKAKEYIEKAIQLSTAGADATLVEHLGDIYYKLGQKEKALEQWQKAQKLEPDNTLLQQKVKLQKLND